jgi:N-acetyltransferase
MATTAPNEALIGNVVRLEHLTLQHVPGLVGASNGYPPLYAWSFVPRHEEDMRAYVQTALEWRDAGTAVPYVTTRARDGTVVGTTRFFDIERWDWPSDHPRRKTFADVCEIGYTWLAPSAMRTACNTEAKLLMLTHAFETWQVLRVCFHADERNVRSRAALERIGARFEGILRAHRLASDFTPRNSARYAILAGEWPQIKERLQNRLLSG